MHPAAARRVSPATNDILRELDVDLERVGIEPAIQRIDARRSTESAASSSGPCHRPPWPPPFTWVGTTVPTAFFANTAVPAVDDLTIDGAGAGMKNYGVGSLLLTNLQILRYEAGEVAHIENVLIGETKERETRRLRRTEETTVREARPPRRKSATCKPPSGWRCSGRCRTR